MPKMEIPMAQYLLTEDQKTLLRGLVPGLKSARIGLNWAVILSSRMAVIFEDGQTNLRALGWSKATRADFNQFVEHGFFRVTKVDRMGLPSKYMLDDALIIQAVENDFQTPESFPEA
jgi:hypothetical protein